MGGILGAIGRKLGEAVKGVQQQIQNVGFQAAGGVQQGSLTPADRYKPSEYKTASPTGQPASYYSYGPSKPYYESPGISGGPFSGGTPAGQPALAGGSSGGGYSGPGTMLPTGQVAFTDISYSDVAQQGRGEKDTYARRFGYPGWDEMVRAMNEPTPAPQSIITQPSQPSGMEAISRKLQEGTGKVGQGLTNVVGALIRPPSAAYAAETPVTTQASGGGLLGALKRKYAEALEQLGTMFGAPELKWSENIAGGATPLTGQTETSAKVFSPYRYTPEEKMVSPLTSTGASSILTVGVPGSQTMFLPGEKPQFVGTQFLPQSLEGGIVPQEETAPITTSPYGGGGIIQSPEVGDYFSSLLNEVLSATPESYAMVDTSSIDGWYQDALKNSGMNEQQSALDAINKQVQVVSDLLDNLDKDITEESKNFLMTEAQRRRLVATRGKPLRDELIKLAAAASKYGVNIKNTLAQLEQQVSLKKSEIQQRLEAQKTAEANKQSRLRNLTSLLPYMYPTAGQKLSAESAMERALLKDQGGSIENLSEW